jgi:hypothetical protein
MDIFWPSFENLFLSGFSRWLFLKAFRLFSISRRVDYISKDRHHRNNSNRISNLSKIKKHGRHPCANSFFQIQVDRTVKKEWGWKGLESGPGLEMGLESGFPGIKKRA